MSGFVVIVDFRLKPGTVEHFCRLIDENARVSVRDEAGCRRFDGIAPAEEPSRILLYEFHDDAAAFELHKRTPHVDDFDDDFDRACAPLMLAKSVTTGRLAFAGTAG